jgi:DNA gyrase subunit A
MVAWAGAAPARAAAATGVPIDLPDPTGKRDGSGTPLTQPLTWIGGPPLTRQGDG